MSETAVAVLDGPTQEVAPYEEQGKFDTGLGDVARIVPTRLIMVQNTTQDPKGARPGQILDDISGIAFDSIKVVPLRTWQSRVLFPPGSNLGADPVCRSDNGFAPSQYAKAPQSQRCASCPHSQWDQVTGKRPPCSQRFEMLVVPKDTGVIDYMPRYLTASGSSVTNYKQAMNLIYQRVSISQISGPKLDLYDFYFTVSAKRNANSRGTYFVMQFDDVQQVATPKEFGPYFEKFVTEERERMVEVAKQLEAAKAEASANEAVNEVIDAEIVEEI